MAFTIVLIITLTAVFILWYTGQLIVDKFYEKDNNPKELIWDFSDTYENTGLPIVALNIDGKYQYFLADSGASINMLKQSFYNELENKPILIENTEEIFTGSGAIKSEYCNVTVSHDNLVFKDEQFNIAQLNVFDANKDSYGIDIVGIVGSSMMEKYKWSIDYDKMQIIIRDGFIQNIQKESK